MYSTARQHSFTRVHVALKDKAHRVHAIVWQVTTGACGLAYCCPCPARHAGTTGEGPASAARVQNGSAAAKGYASHPPPPPPPQHMGHRGRASAPAWGARQEQTLQNPSLSPLQPLQAPHCPQARSPIPARHHRPGHLRRTAPGCRAPGGADPAVGPAAAGRPPNTHAHTLDGNTTWAPKGAPRKWAPPRWPPAAPKQTRLNAAG